MSDRLVSQERKRLRDRLSDDRNAQNLFKVLPGTCNVEELPHREAKSIRLTSLDITYVFMYV